jgi:hypothetical protein
VNVSQTVLVIHSIRLSAQKHLLAAGSIQANSLVLQCSLPQKLQML